MIADIDSEGTERVAIEIGGESVVHHRTDITRAKRLRPSCGGWSRR